MYFCLNSIVKTTYYAVRSLWPGKREQSIAVKSVITRGGKDMQEKSKAISVPVSQKYALTLREAAAYFNIGEKKIRHLVEKHRGEFSLMSGNRNLIVRTKFEDLPDNGSGLPIQLYPFLSMSLRRLLIFFRYFLSCVCQRMLSSQASSCQIFFIRQPRQDRAHACYGHASYRPHVFRASLSARCCKTDPW